MAAIANATLLADVEEHINTEFIDRTVRYTIGRVPKVFRLGVAVKDLRGQSTATYSQPIIDELGAATSHTATDEVTVAKITRSDLTVSTGAIAIRVVLPYDVLQQSLIAEFTNAIKEVTGSVLRNMDNAFLALSPSFGNSIGTDATVNDVANLTTLITAWRTQTGATMGRPLLVMHGDAMRDLHADAMQGGQSILSTAVGVQLKEATEGKDQGLVTSWGQLDFVVTDNIPAGGTGWDNMMLASGDEEAPIAMPVNQDVLVELEHEPKRRAWHVVGSADIGFGITRDNAGLRFRTRT